MIFFVLGSHPDLSIAEIVAVTGHTGQRFGEIYLLDEVEMSLPNLQNRLAGTIKIGSVIGSMKKWNKEDAAELIYSVLVTAPGPSLERRGGKRVEFGISGYGNHLSRNIEPLGLEIKKKLKEDGFSCRLVTSREATLSSVVVAKNNLLTSGGEYVVIEAKDEMLIGQTETIQDFEAWGDRDFGRPARDAKSGMLPPKIARLMINLAGVNPEGASLLDPFCGSGTIPMEAALMGFSEVVGSDISDKAIKDSEKNLRFALGDGEKPRLYLSSAEELKLDGRVDLIVTEPFLGRPQRGSETQDELKRMKDDLTSLYLKSFAHLREFMKPQAKLVVAFPIFRTGSAMTKPLPGFNLVKRFVYEREGQRVAREILVLTRD